MDMNWTLCWASVWGVRTSPRSCLQEAKTSGEALGDAPDAPAGAKLLVGPTEKETKVKGRNAKWKINWLEKNKALWTLVHSMALQLGQGQELEVTTSKVEMENGIASEFFRLWNCRLAQGNKYRQRGENSSYVCSPELRLRGRRKEN